MAIATANKNVGRQYPLVAYQEFTLSEMTSGSALLTVKLPAGAIVVSGFAFISTAFNSGTTDALTIGDGGSAARYATVTAGSGALSANLYKALTPTGYQYTAADTVDLTWTGAGTAATTGAGYLLVTYIVENRANEVVPDYT